MVTVASDAPLAEQVVAAALDEPRDYCRAGRFGAQPQRGACDRRDDVRVVRGPDRKEAQPAGRGHRGRELRHRDGAGELVAAMHLAARTVRRMPGQPASLPSHSWSRLPGPLPPSSCASSESASSISRACSGDSTSTTSPACTSTRSPGASSGCMRALHQRPVPSARAGRSCHGSGCRRRTWAVAGSPARVAALSLRSAGSGRRS